MRDNHTKIERAGRARLMRRELSDLVIEHRDRLVQRLIREYRGRTLTNDLLWGNVGALSTLDEVLEDIERDIHQGEVAAQEEFDGKTSGKDKR